MSGKPVNLEHWKDVCVKIAKMPIVNKLETNAMGNSFSNLTFLLSNGPTQNTFENSCMTLLGRGLFAIACYRELRCLVQVITTLVLLAAAGQAGRRQVKIVSPKLLRFRVTFSNPGMNRMSSCARVAQEPPTQC